MQVNFFLETYFTIKAKKKTRRKQTQAIYLKNAEGIMMEAHLGIGQGEEQQ